MLSGACSNAADPPAQPNILIVVVDDLGWGDVGYNNADVHTPAIDRLAATGVILERHYVYPVCSPTRAALLTGRSALAMGVDGPMSDEAGLPLDIPLLPEKLKQVGYQTFLVGKWHLGLHDVRYFPQSRGFDYFYGHLGGFIEYYSHLYYDGLDWQRNGVSLEEDGHATELLADDAVRVIKARDPSRPFFMLLALNAPHTPVQPPESLEHMYAHIKEPLRADYLRLVYAMDKAIGQVAHALQNEGILDDTLIIFLSDNGGNERDGGADNGPLRGGKGEVFEGGVRVPTFITWKNRLDGGRSYDDPMTVHDWMPTVMSLVGLEKEDGIVGAGIDQWPALTGQATAGTHEFVLGSRRAMALYSLPWKLVVTTETQETLLFNIAEDPAERLNLADTRPDLVLSLTEKLARVPRGRSIADTSPPPENLWRREDGTLDYDKRRDMPATTAPWAEKADSAK